jgi:histidine triad (HIT) family protein
MHSRDLSDTSDQTLGRLLQVSKQLTGHYKTKLDSEGANLLMSSGPAAQQSIPHVHLHLIPRATGDGLDAWPTFPRTEMPDPDALLDLLRVPE